MVRMNLPRELENELALLAVLTGNSIQFHIRQAILEYLDDIEDRVATARWLDAAIAEESRENPPRQAGPSPDAGDDS